MRTTARQAAIKARSRFHQLLPAPASVDLGPSSQVAQRIIADLYARNDSAEPWLPDYGFRVYSQNDEDGILLYLLSKLGFGARRCIEIGLSTAVGSNTTNLITNWGFEGLGIEGSSESARDVREWFERHPDTVISPPTIVEIWVSSGTINQTLAAAGWAETAVDVMSIDIDGADYWVWKAVDCIAPRIVMIEIADTWTPDRSVAVRDDAVFARDRALDTSYLSASLAAMTKLARAKGYRLVGVHRLGFNAFYVREDQGPFPPQVSVERCSYQPKTVSERPIRLPLLEQRDWVEV